MVGEVITNLCIFIGTKRVTTTLHHPQTDGQVLRCNKTIVDMLKEELIDEEQWLDLLPLVTFYYKSSQHRSTKNTPYEAMFGAQYYKFDNRIFFQ